MLRQHVIAYVATIAAAVGAGWFMRRPAPSVPDPPPLPAPVRAVLAPIDDTPLIAVSSDGNVTLRVEQQPLEWVLEQIAKQSGWTDVKARARGDAASAGAPSAAPAPATTCPEPTLAPPIDPARLLHAIERGSEAERFSGLLLARSNGVLVAEATLKWLYETDASERVRVAAFENYLESRIERPDALREALEAALYTPSAAIQREAKRRLEELQEIERIDALSKQGVP